MLKYLFTATFKDGSILQQTQEDRSAIDPEKRNAFYDVMQREDDLVKFEIKGEGHTYGVSLEDGSFVIDGESFFRCPTPETRLRIIFYMNKSAISTSTRDTCALKPIQYVETNFFALGWQTTRKDGRNQHEIMQIK